MTLATTPTAASVLQIPGYIESADALKKAGIDEVLVFCVNDGAVMDAWGRDQNIARANGLITFFADPKGELTTALDIQLTHPGPAGKGLHGRCKRTAMYLDDGVVKVFNIAEKSDDPAGDDFPEITCADALLDALIPFKMEL
jgi:peroxiredoxin